MCIFVKSKRGLMQNTHVIFGVLIIYFAIVFSHTHIVIHWLKIDVSFFSCETNAVPFSNIDKLRNDRLFVVLLVVKLVGLFVCGCLAGVCWDSGDRKGINRYCEDKEDKVVEVWGDKVV